MKRRDFIGLGIAGIGLAGVAGIFGCGSSNETTDTAVKMPTVTGATSAELTFLFLTDIHYRGATDTAWLRKTCATLKQNCQFDLAVVSGDLTENGYKDQITSARYILNELGKPVYFVPGNHDRLDRLGRATTASKDSSGGAMWDRVFSFEESNPWIEHNGWVVAGVDSTWGGAIRNINLRPEVLERVQQKAATIQPGTPVIVFTHMPEIPGMDYGLANGELAKLKAAISPLEIKQAFAGHIHAEASTTISGIPVATNIGCSSWKPNSDGSTKKAVYLVKANKGLVTYEYIEVAA